MKYEKPQKGNPHTLTIGQHIFPRKSIERFLNNAGYVNVHILGPGRCVDLPSDHKIFCASRIWDQRAESGYMKEIEDKFQILVDEIIEGKKSKIKALEKSVIDDFFCLWDGRAYFGRNPIPDQPLRDPIGVEHELTKDEEERLEKAGVGFIRKNLTIPGRQICGARIQLSLFRCREQMEDASWGILKAEQGEFIVPDGVSNMRMVPVTPDTCLYSPSENASITPSKVARINRMAVDSSTTYYFARELSKCPI